jgi:hypothetical protein
MFEISKFILAEFKKFKNFNLREKRKKNPTAKLIAICSTF